MSTSVEIVEVGPRDGLQAEPGRIPVADKVRLIDLLSQTGLRRIEAGSFVSPRWVPQMADSGAVFAGIKRRDGVRYSALTPNLIGYTAARAAGADAVAVFVSATEGFSRANLNASREDSLERIAPVVAAAQRDGVPVRGYVSCVLGCPFEGDVDPGDVAQMAAALWAMGCTEVSLGDTIGVGTPDATHAMLAAVADRLPVTGLAGHFHDTTGRALANIDASLVAGVRVFDASVAGLGGCPYAPGAPGNVATEAVVAHLAAAGYETGVDAARLAEAAALARPMRGQAAEGEGA